MAFTVRLTRNQNQPWGFRLQGGKDFSTPLSIQKVSNDSVAERAGLLAGDAILKINEVNTEHLRHKEAQDAIVRAGNNFELTVQRGAVRTWKPTVTQLSNTTTTTTTKQIITSNEPVLVTKTSLAANKQEFRPIGSSHNVRPTPFGQPRGNTLTSSTSPTVTALVHNPYNSPAGLYSMQNIADTLTAQAEVLSTGAKGFNFMKSDRPVNKESAVYKMLEEESAPDGGGYRSDGGHGDDGVINTVGQNSTQDIQSRSFKVLQQSLDNGEEPGAHTRMANLRHVEAPKVVAPKDPADVPPKLGENLCAECGRVVVGVFVRIKDKNLHADCFKCTTCGSSLRNVGYYNINDKLYCDVHARLVARQNPPSPNLIPYTMAPGGTLPKDVSIVGVSVNTSPYGGQYGSSGAGSPGTIGTPTAVGMAPFSASKRSPTSPISVSVPDPSVYRHPQTAPAADAHRPISGGSKFVWPPSRNSNGTETLIAPSMAPGAPTFTVPTYRAPPTTQHVQFTSTKFKQQQQYGTGSQPAPLPTSSMLSPKISSSSPSGVSPPILQSSKPSVPSSTQPYSPSAGAFLGGAKKPFSPINVSNAKPNFGGVGGVAGPISPGTPSSAWVSASPIGATTKPFSSGPNLTAAASAGSRPAPRRGRGVLNPSAAPGARIPVCASCGTPIRGPFVTALGKTWCTEHFHCVNAQCRRHLQDIGFVEEQGQLYCENCYETYLAPVCSKCNSRIKGDCLNAIGKQWHPECFTCAYCRKAFGNSHFYLEDGLPYCEKDWNELFTTKCVGCGFPIEAGDRWVEALNSNYHSQCFKCTICHKNLEGQSFYAKGGRPFCKTHAR